MVWDGRGGIRTVLVSLNLNGSALGSVPHTCASKHPHPIPRPFHQLVNYEFPRVRILNLDYRCLAVRPGFWDIENLVVGNHSVLLILRRGLPDYAEGGGGLWVSIDHLWRGPWHWRERGELVRTLFWTRTRIPTTPSLDGDNTSCSWPAETKGFLSDCFKSKNISFRLSCSS